MPEANYQSVYRNPYAFQANEPGRDKGLWSVIGRAIRSTVPERRNEKYDPDQPISDENVPFKKPGFFRALLGDRGGDYNRAAKLDDFDLGITRELADEQKNYHTAEQEAGDKRQRGLMGLANDFAEIRDARRDRYDRNRDEMNNYVREKIAGIGARTRLDQTDSNNRLRERLASRPRQLDPTQKALAEAQLKKLQLENEGTEQQAYLMSPAGIAEAEAAKAAKPTTWKTLKEGFASILGGDARQRRLQMSNRNAAPTVPNVTGVVPLKPEDIQMLKRQDSAVNELENTRNNMLLEDTDLAEDEFDRLPKYNGGLKL